MSNKHHFGPIVVRRRFDSGVVAGVWRPHCYSGPPRAASELFRGMRFALLPAVAFWSAAALVGYWLLAAQ